MSKACPSPNGKLYAKPYPVLLQDGLDLLDLADGIAHIEHLTAEFEPGRVFILRVVSVRGTGASRQNSDGDDEPAEHRHHECAYNDVVNLIAFHCLIGFELCLIFCENCGVRIFRA